MKEKMKKKKGLSLCFGIVLAFSSTSVYAQKIIAFEEIPHPVSPIGVFDGVSQGSIAFADVDGDGDQDMLITGMSASSQPIAKLYSNDGNGNFTIVSGTPFDGVWQGSIAFADVDGDGDQDVLITGESVHYGPIAKLYSNDGSGNFTLVENTLFSGVWYSSIAFADVDGDGDQDVLITGMGVSGSPIARMYRNDGSGNFSNFPTIPGGGVMNSSIAFADVDGDGDQDVLITGESSGEQLRARLYLNNGSGNFTIVSGTPFDGVRYSSIAFADVDGDGDQDVLITGRNTSYQPIAKLYTNDGSGNFAEVSGTPFDGVSSSSIAFADVDDDGDQDVLITGASTYSDPIAKLYSNDGSGSFTEVAGTPFDGVSQSSIAFADVDGDGDQDVLITGYNLFSQPLSKLYRNVSCLPTYNVQTETTCESFDWNGTTYTTSGTYTYDYLNGSNCPSTDTLHLTINATHNVEAQTACESYVWNGTTYTTTGTYTFDYTNGNGCPSTDTLHLTINATHNVETETACESFYWNGTTYTTSGTKLYNYTNGSGCPSTDTLHLTINNGTHSVETQTACESFDWNGTTYKTSGTYTYDYLDVNSCPSTDTLHLTINATHNVETETACESFYWNGTTYTTSGPHTYEYVNGNGCSSTDTLHLTINQPTSSSLAVTACSSYTWLENNQTYTESGAYTHVIPNANNCDSTITLNLTINQPTSSSLAVTACSSYTWLENNQTYTASGAYTHVVPNANNCDSTITLNLTINQPTSSSLAVTECGSYTWLENNQIYTASGAYTHVVPNANNCDSTITLNLTINATHNVETEIACESFDWKGDTYTTSGTHTFDYTNANGCPSTDTLHLTINQPTSSSFAVTACGSYTWLENNQTYTESGSYMHVIPNANNCDSTITLNLTINQPTSSSLAVTECSSYTWLENNETYTASGAYTHVISNANNCDSTITLNLTINQPTNSSLAVTECDSYTWLENNETYTASGAYTHVIPNANNCDSTITLNLTINTVDNTVSVNGSELTANQTGATYQWIDCDDNNAPIAGETAQTFTPTANGNYAVEVTANGCTETSDCIVVNSVGIIEAGVTEFIEVYPNPNNGIFTVSTNQLQENTLLEIYSQDGRLIYSTVYSGTETTIDLKNESRGVYILKVNNTNYFRVIKN